MTAPATATIAAGIRKFGIADAGLGLAAALPPPLLPQLMMMPLLVGEIEPPCDRSIATGLISVVVISLMLLPISVRFSVANPAVTFGDTQGYCVNQFRVGLVSPLHPSCQGDGHTQGSACSCDAHRIG